MLYNNVLTNGKKETPMKKTTLHIYLMSKNEMLRGKNEMKFGGANAFYDGKIINEMIHLEF